MGLNDNVVESRLQELLQYLEKTGVLVSTTNAGIEYKKWSVVRIAETVKERWREKSPGGCAVLSAEGNCDCTLCLIDDIIEVVESL